MFDPDEIMDSSESIESEIQDNDLDALGDSDDLSLQMSDMLGDEFQDLDDGPMQEGIDDIDLEDSLEGDAASSGIVLGVPEGELLGSIQPQDYEPDLDSDYIQTEPDIDPLAGGESDLNSIVKVSTDSGSWGSGVFLNPDSIPELAERLNGDKLILTADHVAQADSDGLVEVAIGPGGETVMAEVIRPHLNSDLAFLRVKASDLGDANVSELPLASSSAEGEPVLQAGFPESSPGMVIDSGVVAHRGSTTSWLGHTAESEPGDSGGPVINSSGEIVGINSGEGEFRTGPIVEEMPMGMNHQHIEEVIRLALKENLF